MPLMTSSGAKKLILAEFYGFSGLRKALFWKNCLASFITVRLTPMQKRTLNSKIVVSLSQNQVNFRYDVISQNFLKILGPSKKGSS